MRTRLQPSAILLLAYWLSRVVSIPTVHQTISDTTYTGITLDGVETFYSIPYGQDTGGANRFKVPQPYVPTSGSAFNATVPGPKCPQVQKDATDFVPLYLSNVTEVSEDCLHLNIYRAAGTNSSIAFPVYDSFVFVLCLLY